MSQVSLFEVSSTVAYCTLPFPISDIQTHRLRYVSSLGSFDQCYQ